MSKSSKSLNLMLASSLEISSIVCIYKFSCYYLNPTLPADMVLSLCDYDPSSSILSCLTTSYNYTFCLSFSNKSFLIWSTSLSRSIIFPYRLPISLYRGLFYKVFRLLCMEELNWDSLSYCIDNVIALSINAYKSSYAVSVNWRI